MSHRKIVSRILALPATGLCAPLVSAAQRLARVIARRTCGLQHVEGEYPCPRCLGYGGEYGCSHCLHTGRALWYLCDCGDWGEGYPPACPRCSTENWHEHWHGTDPRA